jgi:subtilisin-like proprotein convertase family protein
MLNSRLLSLAITLAASALAPAASAQCISGGAGGFIPASGTGGGGAWLTTLPASPFTSPLAVTVPAGATVLNSVKLNGLDHTWGGDLQFVLQDPAGNLYNILCGMDADPGDLVNGDMTIIDPAFGGAGFFGGGTTSTGTYAQDYGTWVDGTLSIMNTPLEQIPIASGTWTLYGYDWVGLDSGSLTSWELCFGQPTPPPPPPPTLSCLSAAAPAAVFPASGSANGAWPTTLPTGGIVSTAAIAVPPGATVAGVKLIGFQHTWNTDVMVTLTDPAGVEHLILQRDNGSNCAGCADTYNGDYTFSDLPGSPNLPNCGVGAIASGTYLQTFGAWPTGSANIFNTPISTIPASSGTWKLNVYDWCIDFDDGFLTAWELCFAAPAAPVSYCTAGTTTNGCNATISASANPSVSLANACTISVTNVEGQKTGLVFYSITGRATLAWNASSFLCVKAPTQRSGPQSSGGTVLACDGTLSLDWNAYQLSHPTALGQPWSSGDVVQVQAWFRDPPAGKSTNLSNAIEMTYAP